MKELQGVLRRLAGASNTLSYIAKSNTGKTEESLNMARQHVGNAVESIQVVMEKEAKKHFNIA
jgi:hypothetical protein